MKKLRYYYWLISSLVRKHTYLILIAAVFSTAFFLNSQTLLSNLPRPRQTIYIGRVGLYDLSSLPGDIQLLVSSGLTRLEPDGSAVAALAKDWQIIDSGQTYIFTLKDGLTWQDGQTLTSADINYTFPDVRLETPDPQTAIFHLPEAFSPFPAVVSQPLLKRVNTSTLGLFPTTKIIGTADFTITDLKSTGRYIQQITLESDSEKRIYRFYNSETAAITAYKLGEIDRLEDLTEPGELAQWTNHTITATPNLQRYSVVFFNTSDPNLSDKTIRQALTYAIPTKPTGSDRALGPVSSASWAYNPRVKTYDYSLDDARDLLSQVNSDFEIELTTSPAFVTLAENIKASWEQLDLTVKIKITNNPDPDNFQALLIGQQIPKDPDQYLLWHSTQDTNITGYQSAKVDKLLEDGRQELDPEQRKLIYQDFQRFLVEDSPAAFISYLSTYTVTRN